MKTLLEIYLILYNWFQVNISFFKKYMRIQLRFLTYSFENAKLPPKYTHIPCFFNKNKKQRNNVNSTKKFTKSCNEMQMKCKFKYFSIK